MATNTIFKATYSGVPVFEMPCKSVAVMKRRADGWLNATQILKVAGFDKPQRTRVLEREVQKGQHEKIQGGYGKYQGTWVPLERGVALAQQYDVEHLLRPIFEFVPTAESPPLAPKHVTQATTGRPRKNKAATPAPAPPQAGPSHAQQYQQPMPPPQPRQTRPRNVVDNFAASQQLSRVDTDKREMSPTPSNASSDSQTPSPINSHTEDGSEWGGSRKRQKQHHGEYLYDPALGGGPAHYARAILDYFVSEAQQIPNFLVQPPADFDPNVVIDDDGHTALHWACAMGRVRIVKLLLTAGADIFRANAVGQTALMRSVMFTNNYDLRRFPELFELLHRSTINIDRQDRTVFHYIVGIALEKGKTHAARYYLETCLQRLSDYPREVADILNFQDQDGETALTLAARARSRKIVKVLLDYGSDRKVVTRDGKSAEDYIVEDERFRAAAAGQPYPISGVPAFNGAGEIHQPVPRHSQTAQHTSTVVIPQIAQKLETLAEAYDAEMLEKERDVTQAQSLLGGMQTQLTEGQATLARIQHETGSFDEANAKIAHLEKQLKDKVACRYRLGWEKYMRDEETREKNVGVSVDPNTQTLLEPIPTLPESYADLTALYAPPTNPNEAVMLQNEIKGMHDSRMKLFDDLVAIQARSGTEARMTDYRKLIALGCGVKPEEVDGVIEGILETLEADA